MRKLVILFVSILLMSFISASFSVGNITHQLQSDYGPGKTINGWVNISFVNEDGGKLLKDSSGNSIQLLKLLKNQTAYSYTCIPSSCDVAYSSSNPEVTKTKSLNLGQEILIGFNLTGKVKEVTFSGLEIESDAGADCYNQLKVDFLNDGTYEKGNTKNTTGSCSLKSYGCYDTARGSEINLEQGSPYCEQINLTESPGFKLGAWVKKVGAESKIKMYLKDSYGYLVQGTSCDLPSASMNGGEISCENGFLVTEPTAYYVCIEPDGATNYTAKGYEDSANGCGTYGESLDVSGAYSIFAEGRKFGAVENLTITNSLPNENTVSDLILDYLSANYDSENCESSGCIADCTQGCIIPLKIKSGKSQTITLKNLALSYKTGGVNTNANLFYELTESSPKINSGFGKFLLNNGGFKVPTRYGNYTFNLLLENSNIITQKVSVERVPEILSLSPTLTVSALPTEFEVKTNSSSTISTYYWKFGDNQDERTSTNKVTHTYNATGIYNLEIEVTDGLNKVSTRTFSISVLDPKTMIAKMLDEKKSGISKVQTQLNLLNDFQKRELTKVIGVEIINNKLKDLEQRYKTQYREEDYNKIVSELFYLEVPSAIEVSKIGGNISFYTPEELINLGVLGEIEQSKEISGDESAYKEAILGWDQENLGIELSFQEISGFYDDVQRTIGIFYKIDVTKKTDPAYSIYFILKKLDGLVFKENYLESEKSDYEYFPLKNLRSIEFFTTEDVLFNELPLFISPGIDRLSVINVNIVTGNLPIRWALLLLVLVLVLILGLVVYIVLQEWYRKRYENYLFKDQTNLYNLILYIDSSTKKGLSEFEIAKKLDSSGWDSEQITYALKKYAGKRTGMFEIPINKILEKLKRSKEETPQQVNDLNQKVPQIPPKAIIPSGIRPLKPFSRMPSRLNQMTQNLQKNRDMFFKK